MSAYDCQQLWNLAFDRAEKAIRHVADSDPRRDIREYAGDPNLRHDVADWVADCWRSALYERGGFESVAGTSPNLEVRRVPDLVDAAMRAVSTEFRSLGVTKENAPW